MSMSLRVTAHAHICQVSARVYGQTPTTPQPPHPHTHTHLRAQCQSSVVHVGLCVSALALPHWCERAQVSVCASMQIRAQFSVCASIQIRAQVSVRASMQIRAHVEGLPSPPLPRPTSCSKTTAGRSCTSHVPGMAGQQTSEGTRECKRTTLEARACRSGPSETTSLASYRGSDNHVSKSQATLAG